MPRSMASTPSPPCEDPQNVNPNKNNTPSRKRLYQVWKGSNRFFLGGRLIFGPDVRSLLLTLSLIVVPMVVFCEFVARLLLVKFSRVLGITVMVIAIAHTVAVLFILFLTSARDPGIIPRNKLPPAPEEDIDISNLQCDFVGGLTPYAARLPRTKDVIVNGVAVKVKYCDTCMLYRPPRCSHCSICNNCVERFDHHCPWVGQCIGRRNYPFFMMFVSMLTVLCIFVFAISAVLIKKLMEHNKHTLTKALWDSPASLLLMLFSFCAMWFVGGITFFHLYLISNNQTTYENFRSRYGNKVNPYNLGPLHNFKEMFCTHIPPSKNDFRAKVEEEQYSASYVLEKSKSGRIENSTRRQSIDAKFGINPAWPQTPDKEPDYGKVEAELSQHSWQQSVDIELGLDPGLKQTPEKEGAQQLKEPDNIDYGLKEQDSIDYSLRENMKDGCEKTVALPTEEDDMS